MDNRSVLSGTEGSRRIDHCVACAGRRAAWRGVSLARRVALAFLLIVAMLAPGFAFAEGDVRVPLATYHALLESTRSQESAAPSFAIGEARLSITVDDESSSAELIAELPVRSTGTKPAHIVLLPPGTAVTSAELDGNAIELAVGSNGLMLVLADDGAHRVRLIYRVAIDRTTGGTVLAFPLPPSTSTKLNAILPGSSHEASLIPITGRMTAQPSENATAIAATIPGARAAQLTWRTPSEAREGHAVSRARWIGVLAGDAVRWKLHLDAEVFGTTAAVPIVPSSLALTEVFVDKKPATVVAGEDHFSALLKGRGRHELLAELAIPVAREDGPPHIELPLQPVPMSRFELELPGKKEVTAEPAANVALSFRGGSTFAVIQAPMTDKLKITWSEAVPEDAKIDARANAAIHHLFHVEEGVLQATAIISLEITRGETNLIELEVPEDVQVNAMTSPSGAISDWRLAGRRASVFLDRRVKGDFELEVKYERTIGADFVVPLVRMIDVQRQRGMIALLQSQDVSLKPVEENQVTKVGENALPPEVREKIKMTVAQAYKYVEGKARVSVQTVAPERKQGRFDAAIDTLVSISEAAMRGQAAIGIDVKAGKLSLLELVLPAGVEILGVSAPSLRSHRIKEENGIQKIEVQFTQEMEGQFAVDLGFERVLTSATETVVPDISVSGAEVVQGRFAVEALAASKIQAARAERISPVDPASLPRQLVLRTTNPILLAYEYVRNDPPPVLALRIDRHAKIETQVATIDSAKYETLFLEDGLAVTTARYQIRNTRKQFLELELPEGSELWSALVDGKSEKPARADRKVLVQVLSSTKGFGVELVYATKMPALGTFGTIRAVLPRTDMVVTETRWDVYLPDALAYETPGSNLKLTAGPRAVRAAQMAAIGQDAAGNRDLVQPLRIVVPMTGTMFSFEKLYASQSADVPTIEIGYASAGWKGFGQTLWVLGFVGALLAAALFSRRYLLPRLRDWRSAKAQSA